MKLNINRWIALCLFAICFWGLFALNVMAEGAAPKDQGEFIPNEESVVAFSLQKEFPLLRGKLAFRLFETFRKGKVAGAISIVESPYKTNAKIKKETDATVPTMLCPGGETFGVRLLTEGVMIVSVGENEPIHPAYDAGMRASDVILEMNGTPIRKVDDVSRVMEACDGSAIKVTCKRDGKELKFELTPHYEAEKGTYKAGIWIKDTVAGIGTVTYYHPTDGSFGGLGHGICDMDTGALVPITRGAVLDVSVTEILRGQSGKPGEIRGFLKHDKKGVLLKNDHCGVFGVLSPIPKHAEAIPVGKRTELHSGRAILRCALGEDKITDYEIEIGEIDMKATSSKCFAVTVTDPALLQKTGGIIQGMSGSPIIQDGKLVGAVTHVMIANPTKGYGIFIENMLSVAGR